MRGKGTVFFSPEKFAPHSLTRFLENCFFFPRVGKKKHLFFFRGKVWKPLTRQKNWDLQKKVKKGKKMLIFALFQIFAVFFFISKLVFFCGFYFFSWKSLHLTHLRIFREREKKTGWKTKTPFSLTNSIFAQKSKK